MILASEHERCLLGRPHQAPWSCCQGTGFLNETELSGLVHRITEHVTFIDDDCIIVYKSCHVQEASNRAWYSPVIELRERVNYPTGAIINLSQSSSTQELCYSLGGISQLSPHG